MDVQKKQYLDHLRKKYLPDTQEDAKLKELRRIDRKIENAMLVPALLLGIIGALVLGSGMSLIMVYGRMIPGIAIGIAGMVLVGISYPVGCYFKKKKQKLLQEKINSLCAELL